MRLIFYLLTSFLYAGLLQDDYFIAIKKNEPNVLDQLSSYTSLLPPPGKYYADPILFTYQGTNYIFFEDYDYRKGIISYVTIEQNLQTSEPKKALELPIHLSFPCLFQDGDEIYMIPETYDHCSITLFQAVQFPHLWTPKRILVEGEKFSDPILFKHNGYYWLFAAVHQDKLLIYYAKDLEGPFVPHPINTASIRGRNAGQVFILDNQLIRPTMDCSVGYGKSIVLKEILSLTTQTFLEQEIATIDPTWAPNLSGTHGYSQNEELVVYDGRRTSVRRHQHQNIASGAL